MYINIVYNCKGYIIAGCDWSYESQDNPNHSCRLCPVNDFSLDIVENYDKVLEEMIV